MRRGPAIAVLWVTLCGCASAPPPASAPVAGQSHDYRQRAVSRTDGALRVSAAVLSPAESERVYGVPLASKSIQPVWVEVENREDRAYFVMSPGLDPDFFPASEVAEAFATNAASAETLARRFRRLAFRNPVPAGTKSAGFVLTHRDEGGKLVQLDLVASGRVKTFAILAGEPGFRADYHASGVFGPGAEPSGKVVDYTDDIAFLAALEQLPACVTNKDGSRNGDPLNLCLLYTSPSPRD